MGIRAGGADVVGVGRHSGGTFASHTVVARRLSVGGAGGACQFSVHKQWEGARTSVA